MGRIAAFVVVLVAGNVALAQPKPEGTRLFEEGRELAKAGKYPEACEAFQKSLAIDRAPGTALNYGDCLEHLGQLRRAWQMYDEAAREFDKRADARGKFARERANTVTPKLGTITVKIAEPATPGLIVKISNESIPPAAELVELFDPGTIDVTASAPGKTAFQTSARTAAGANVIVEIPALAAGDGAAPPPPKRVDAIERRDRKRVKLAIGVGGAGGVGLVVGGILALSARSSYQRALDDMECVRDAANNLVCNQDGADRVSSAAFRANLATGFVIGGGVLAVAAVVLFVTAPRETLITPTVSSESVGLSFGRSF
jgi:tetratricopeptide (TPR) repeat protein